MTNIPLPVTSVSPLAVVAVVAVVASAAVAPGDDAMESTVVSVPLSWTLSSSSVSLLSLLSKVASEQ